MSALLSPIPYHLLAYGTLLGSQLYQVSLFFSPLLFFFFYI